jgi:hypothetical protein
MHSNATGLDQHRAEAPSRQSSSERKPILHDGTVKPMLFVHIPKTAGTSLRHGVAEFLGKNCLVLDYGPKQAATSDLVRRWYYRESSPEKFRTAFDSRGKKFLSGHICLADYVGGFDLDNVAVFLRDPVQRVISEHRHYVRHYGYQGSLVEFAETTAFQNKQARALAGVPIHRLGVVGLAERYEESLARLNAHFGWKVPSRNVNMGRKQLSEAYQVDRQTRRVLEQNNPLDLALYKSACELFDQNDRSRLRMPPGPATGSCKLTDDLSVQGWACQVGSERATKVRIVINGKTAATVSADLFRPDIRRRGLKRSGCAGFRIQIDSISPGDEIRCFEIDGDTELNNSPLRAGASN